ncbi:hypothetical protein QE609_24050, partial [Escherichia coli]|nr:hypothetical protein [Escherichia coli]MDH7290689.1 hypothetical protein [Escherichia coli]HEF0908548.1 hypothetical protein [Escherichia coli]
MSKKFTKTILSSAVAGLMLVSSGAMALDIPVKGSDNLIIRINDSNNEMASIIDKSKKTEEVVLGAINTTTGSIMAFNKKEVTDFLEKHGKSKTQDYFNSIAYPVYLPELKLENIKKLKGADVEKIKKIKDDVSKIITSKTAADYNQAVSNGMSSEAALTVAKDGGGAVLKEFNRIDSKIVTDTTFAIDADGNITLDETAGTGERYGVKDVVADLVADTTVYAEEDGSLTMDNSAPARKRVNEALVDLDKSVRERTTVG